MSPVLGPCPACARHVRVSEARCPFCDVSLEGHTLRVVPDAPARMSRVAMLAFATSVGLVVPTAPTRAHAQANLGSAASAYGGAPPDPSSLRLGGRPGPDPGALTSAYGGPGVEPRRMRGSVIVVDVRIDRRLTTATVYRSTLQRYLSRVRALYERQLAQNPTLRGAVTLEFDLARDGTVGAVRAHAGDELRSIEPVIVRVLQGLQFPERARPGVLVVRLRLQPLE